MAAISSDGLVKRFERITALDGVSLEVRAGSTFGLLGPNGAGKSTLIRILATVLLPDGGSASVCGRDVVRSAGEARRLIGYIPQSFTSDPDLTVAENLIFAARLHSMPRAPRNEAVERALALMGLADRRDGLVRTLSGGLRRRLEIARALLHGPGVLLLDEPASGMDPLSRDVLWETLARLKDTQGLTTIIATHHLEEAERHCDEVAILDRGRVIATASPRGLGGGRLADLYRRYAAAEADQPAGER